MKLNRADVVMTGVAILVLIVIFRVDKFAPRRYKNLQYCARISQQGIVSEHQLVMWWDMVKFVRTVSWDSSAEIILHNPCRRDLARWKPEW